MPKFFGVVGFAVLTNSDGVWKEDIREISYYGDINRNNRYLQSTNQVNDDISVSNEISIVADPYARNNFHLIRYVKFMGTKWKVTSVNVQTPRLILTLGGVYNKH